MTDFFEVDDIPVELRMNTRRRSRIGISISPTGHVVLDAPPSTRKEEVISLVHEHRRWLRHRLDKVQEETAHMGKLGYGPGEIIRFLGESLILEYHDSPEFIREGHVLRAPSLEEASVRDGVRNWYRQEAQIVFSQVIDSLLHLPWLEGEIPRWRHRFMKSQWGSCSAKGMISLNTHLVRTPIRLVEYVAMHELCHLRHLNHSRRFYSLLSQHMPDWSVRSKELGRNISLLLD
ncbi:M48 family metallopeptidase [Gammaproteobacteria bacterium]|nr:M48 family metallopeptidase [Gammaproteobacteria bacterium]